MQPEISVTVDVPLRCPTVDGVTLADWLRCWRALYPRASFADMWDSVPSGLLPDPDGLWRARFRAVARDVLGDTCPPGDD